MALIKGILLVNVQRICQINFSTSSHLNNKWRRQLGLEDNPRQYSPLTYLPDYSFVDGRPVPLSKGQKKRRDLQEKYCRRIVELTHEVDVAVEVYNENQRLKKENEEKILKNKLKPKGAAFKEN